MTRGCSDQSDIALPLLLRVVFAFARVVEAKSPYTHGHSERVAAYAMTLASAVGLPQEQWEKLRKGALLHDVGKVSIPDSILDKPESQRQLTSTLYHYAQGAGLDIKVGRYPFKNHGKNIASGETDGFVKTVFDAKTGALLGAHMIGAEVTEMIQGFTIAMTMEATEAELIATCFPHPTMSEAMHEATLAAYGRAIHV